MSGSIPQDFIRDIVDTTDIVSLVDAYLPLKRKGKDHWGICPFCEDGKNPSFSVSEQKQFYYCFKCRATGNVIGFLQSHQGFDFPILSKKPFFLLFAEITAKQLLVSP